MQTLNLQQAEPDPAALIAKMHGGESSMIAKDGEFLARLTRVHPTSALSQKRTPMVGWVCWPESAGLPTISRPHYADDMEEMFYGTPDKFNLR